MQATSYLKNKYILFLEKLYIKRRFNKTFGCELKWENPKTFNGKIQWLKLHDRNPLYTKLADKYEVRTYVEEKIGSSYLNELHGVWTSHTDINFNTLPNQFIFKTTHGSNWNIICHSKSDLKIPAARKRLKKWLSKNYYDLGREWVYKDILPRIICEKYLGPEILDYKIFCFNGEPTLIQIDVDRYSNHRRIFYDVKWNIQLFTVHYPKYAVAIPKPGNLDEMIYVACKLSKNIPFVRVDLYSINGIVLFGEMTFFPGNGFEKFLPEECDYEVGRYLNLNDINKSI